MTPADHDLRPAICVLGIGLIGGSLLRAAQAAGRHVWGYDRSEAAAAAAQAAGFDTTADLDLALRRASDARALIVLAVPMPALTALLKRIAVQAPQCPITDVTSVKTAVQEHVSKHGLLEHFVGGHPMAGTAESGWQASDAHLFSAATWVVSVDPHVDPTIWAQVAQLALDCGAVVVPARADEHDAGAAAISHLPHLLAEALAATADGASLAYSLAAGSFRDGTRVAGTNPGLVRAMCENNAQHLVPLLEKAITLLSNASASLAEKGTVEDLVSAGHTARTRYEAHKSFEITGISRTDADWRERLAEQGRLGGVLRSIP